MMNGNHLNTGITTFLPISSASTLLMPNPPMLPFCAAIPDSTSCLKMAATSCGASDSSMIVSRDGMTLPQLN